MHDIAFMERQGLAKRNEIIKSEFMRRKIVIGEKILGRPEKTFDRTIPVKLLADLADDGFLRAFADFGTAAGIREEGSDPDEIVVTGSRRRNMDRDRIAIGADALVRCSSVVFDKRAREIRLTCA